MTRAPFIDDATREPSATPGARIGLPVHDSTLVPRAREWLALPMKHSEHVPHDATQRRMARLTGL
jgi:hypothetical protein